MTDTPTRRAEDATPEAFRSNGRSLSDEEIIAIFEASTFISGAAFRSYAVRTGRALLAAAKRVEAPPSETVT